MDEALRVANMVFADDDMKEFCKTEQEEEEGEQGAAESEEDEHK